MRCEDVRTQLLDVTDEALMPTDVREHLQTCAECSEHLAMLNRHHQLLGTVPSPSAPVELWERIHQGIVSSPRQGRGQLWWAAAAAMVLITAGLAYQMLNQPPEVIEILPAFSPVVEAPMNGKSVDYLVIRHAVLENGNILNTDLVNKTEQNEYLIVVGDGP